MLMMQGEVHSLLWFTWCIPYYGEHGALLTTVFMAHSLLWFARCTPYYNSYSNTYSDTVVILCGLDCIKLCMYIQ